MQSINLLPNWASAASGAESRKLLALPGIAVVVAALLTAGASFAVLMGVTPIVPSQQITLTLAVVNGAMILVLLLLIAREINRILRARKHGRAAARLHVRIVILFSLVAAIPAVVVAIVASVTLNVGLDRWFELRTKEIVNSSISIARSYVEENARNLQSTSLSMAVDLDSARTIYSLDRNGFQELVNSQATGRGLLQATLLRQDGSIIVASRKADGIQEWNLKGATNHPFHLHIYHVQVQSSCVPYEAGEYYDVIAGNCAVRFDLNPATSTVYEGRTIMHCHILEHEDMGMMANFEIL